jgi:hypothetical protein
MNSADKTPISKSQARLIALAGITTADNYSAASEALVEAGFSGSGVPAGGTWRTAAKLIDEQLVAATKIDRNLRESADYGF